MIYPSCNLISRWISACCLNLIMTSILFAQPVNPTCDDPGPKTLLTLGDSGKAICWNDNGIALVGYDSFPVITATRLHNGLTSPDVPVLFNTIQLEDRVTPAIVRRGVNFMRIMLFGSQCVRNATPCKLDTNPEPKEMMPFKNIGAPNNPNYLVINTLANPEVPLRTIYRNRLINTLVAADKAGVIVMLTLFERCNMHKNYIFNPWRPQWNNMDAVCAAPTPACTAGTAHCESLSNSVTGSNKNPFPEFYEICKGRSNPCIDSELTCLGKIQQNFVKQILDVVRNGNPEPGSNGHFRNVFFEIMNEALSSTEAGLYDPTKLARWHNTVGSWVHRSNLNGGPYLVTANIQPANRTTNWPNCTAASCNNEFKVYKEAHVNIVSLHAGDWWSQGPCQTAVEAMAKFSKPILISDDGTAAGSARNNASNVLGWAQITRTCGGTIGKIAFTHIDGIRMVSSDQTGCTLLHDDCLDCLVLQKLGEVPPLCIRPSNCGENPVNAYCP
jgi:hypothetical protein